MTYNEMMNHLSDIRRIYFNRVRSFPIGEYRHDCQLKLAALSRATELLKNSENMTTFIDDQMTITRDAIDRASHLESELQKRDKEINMLQLALAAALEHLQGGVLLVQDAPTDRLMVDQTIDGSYFVKLRKETDQ